MQPIKFIDLFAGMGGFRLGFEQAALEQNRQPICVFSSEIKPYAIQVYKDNYNNEDVAGDITKIDSSEIPDFDVLFTSFYARYIAFGRFKELKEVEFRFISVVIHNLHLK